MNEYVRKDGLFVEFGGVKRWYKNNRLHREDGPAVEYSDVHKYWFLNGVLHRVDGPAVEDDGNKYWYLNGNKIDCSSQEEFNRIVRIMAFL